MRVLWGLWNILLDNPSSNTGDAGMLEPGSIDPFAAIIPGATNSASSGVGEFALSSQIYSQEPGPSLAANGAQVDAALNVANLHVNGAGITVGVISGSFNSLGLAAADLGYGTVLPQQSAVKILGDTAVFGGDDEGRAMMQIVHDIAPGASIDFDTYGNGSDQGFANAILNLAAAGCKVICDDIAITGVPWFQSGVVTQAIQTVEQQGVTFLYSADNYRGAPSQTTAATDDPGYESTWQSTGASLYFYPTGTQNFSDALKFSNGTAFDPITLAAGASATFQLQWAQPWGAATSNLALVFSIDNGGIFDVLTDTTAGDSYAVFERSGNVTPSGETTSWVNDPYINQSQNNSISGANKFPDFVNDTGSAETIFVSIINLAGNDPSQVKLIATSGTGGNPPGAITIGGENAGTSEGQESPYGMAIGAVDSGNTPAFGGNPPLTEYFSSSATGDQWLFNSGGTALANPTVLSSIGVSGVDDINASDIVGGTDYNANFDDFYGTSAAAPSIAGVVALMLQANPDLTFTQIEKILAQTATAAANSAVAGAGLVNAQAAVNIALSRNMPGYFTGSGVADVLWINPANKTVGDWLMNNGTPTWQVVGQGSSSVNIEGFGDFTGNGISDILWENPTNGVVGDWLMNNNQPTWQQIGQGSTTMNIAGVGDFNGDGTTDILWQNPTNNYVGIWQMKNNAPTWEAIGYGSTTVNIAGVGDFTGSGKDEILWENPSNAVVGMWTINGSTPAWSQIGQGSTSMNIVGVGDFTGNGTDDILWENPSNGTVGFWGMTNGQATSWNVISTASTAYQVAGIGDYYGTGTDDILWRNPGTGDTGIWQMSNGHATWHDLGIASTTVNPVKA